MTREEAIQIIKSECYVFNPFNFDCPRMINTALDMAIKALETVEEFEKAQIITGGRLNGRTYAYKCGLEDGERKALEQEPCEDAVSRREAIKKFTYNHKGERIPDYDCDNFPTQIDIKTVKEILRDLPPITPQQKMGKWIAQDIHNCHTDFKCSECGYTHNFTHLYGEPTADYTYCPNCGTKMQEVKE